MMDNDLRKAARDVLIRYGGDTFPNLFHSAKGSIVVDDEGRAVLVRNVAVFERKLGGLAVLVALGHRPDALSMHLPLPLH